MRAPTPPPPGISDGVILELRQIRASLRETAENRYPRHASVARPLLERNKKMGGGSEKRRQVQNEKTKWEESIYYTP